MDRGGLPLDNPGFPEQRQDSRHAHGKNTRPLNKCVMSKTQMIVRPKFQNYNCE